MQLSKLVLALSTVGFAAADTYSCKGSSQCHNDLIPAFQSAWQKISDEYTYRAGGKDSGVCASKTLSVGAAGIFVKGNGCTAKGGVLKQFYDEIRNRGCKACGFVDFGNGCQIKLDYVTGCAN
ncbi:putative bacteriodes thetaiotaomicron symbiotic chitinase protein [Fusarium sp. Ph1]|nr:putative bacteriodes thetaiotaomicron symbiotic chitinase protein [Fusarium sp. Ph1]